jgi:hypothetical protein
MRGKRRQSLISQIDKACPERQTQRHTNPYTREANAMRSASDRSLFLHSFHTLPKAFPGAKLFDGPKG